MASNEVSKITWGAIGVVFVSIILGVTSGRLPGLTQAMSPKPDANTEVVKPTDTAGVDNGERSNHSPDPNDAKWITKGVWGSNGKFVVDKDGNAVIYAIDASKPIIFHSMATENTKLPTDTLTTLTFQAKVQGDTNSSMNSAFAYSYNNLKTIHNLDTNVDTSNVTHMAGMFAGSKLTSVGDLGKWNTLNVTDMSHMFRDSNLTSVGDLSQWNTSNVTNMNSMFGGSKLPSVGDLSQWNTSKVTNMVGMFSKSQLTPPAWYH